MGLYIVSRFFFFAFLVAQHVLLSKFVADHEDNLGFYGLVAMLLIPVGFWIVTLCSDELPLKQYLSTVWFLYSCVLVIMIGVIFGRAVIEDNKLREQEIATCLCTRNVNATTDHSFFDSKFLKITLCFTPGLMLLLLTSVTDKTETLRQLYLMIVMDLFDGIEMIEVLHEDICDKIPMGWEIAVLVAALLFFLLSFLEVHQVKFDEDEDDAEPTLRKKKAACTLVFQIILNVAFLVIRLVLWFHYDFDSAIFLAKNVISLVMGLVDVCQ
ncbi:Hypothetical predicted protein [Paramuricea clavata]|uniref:Uncharacterized protein n=1 Tax=Paramuricea clavata TaxID=317549 RepID=A0A6S7I473_PARCT|nr:Hypothetical predicted protein [Paramuricea clavata]